VDARRLANIDAMFRSFRVTRTEVHAAAIARVMSANDAYCAGFDTCVSGGRIMGGSGGMRLAMSRVGAVLEVTLGEQFVSQRESGAEDDAFAQRSSRGSLLFRFGPTRPTARTLDLLAGATLIVTDTRGVTRVKQALAPIGGRHPFSERRTAIAFTTGANFIVPVTRVISVVVPVRMTALVSAPPARSAGRFDVQAGVGFSVRTTQRVW
jgi:hypothetical protein